MKSDDHALNRLFAAARRVPPDQDQTVPLGLEARILALRREAPAHADDLLGVLRMFRRGLAVAGLVALITLWICRPADETSLPAMDVTVLDSAEEISFLP